MSEREKLKKLAEYKVNPDSNLGEFQKTMHLKAEEVLALLSELEQAERERDVATGAVDARLEGTACPKCTGNHFETATCDCDCHRANCLNYADGSYICSPKPLALTNNHGLFEFRGVDCPYCHEPIALWAERFKGSATRIMHVRHVETDSAKCTLDFGKTDLCTAKRCIAPAIENSQHCMAHQRKAEPAQQESVEQAITEMIRSKGGRWNSVQPADFVDLFEKLIRQRAEPAVIALPDAADILQDNDEAYEALGLADYEGEDGLHSHITTLIAQKNRAEAALRTLRQASAWIPVSERLPNPYPERVLFATTDRGVYKGWRQQATISHGSRGGEKYWKWVSRGDGDWDDKAVTHWMQLPEAPNSLAAALAAEGGK